MRWETEELCLLPDASLLVDAEIQTEAISLLIGTLGVTIGTFVSFPYDLKMSEIKLSSDARFVVLEYDGKSVPIREGESWRQPLRLGDL